MYSMEVRMMLTHDVEETSSKYLLRMNRENLLNGKMTA